MKKYPQENKEQITTEKRSHCAGI